MTLALAFATKCMTKEKLLVRVLRSCETMANASVICSDKTGTLTQNAMTVVAGSGSVHTKFVSDNNAARSNTEETLIAGRDSARQQVRRFQDDFSVSQDRLDDVLPDQLRLLFNASIAVNSTAFENQDPATGLPAFVGSKTETALLQFAKDLRWPNYKATRDAADVVQMIPCSSELKAMGVVVRLPTGACRLLLKGASEILTKRCTRHVVVQNPGGPPLPDAIATNEIG